MTYIRHFYMSGRTEERTALQAQDDLSGFYRPEFLEYVFTNGVHFCLPLGTIGSMYTKDDNGMVPMPGFFGTIEEVPDFD